MTRTEAAYSEYDLYVVQQYIGFLEDELAAARTQRDALAAALRQVRYLAINNRGAIDTIGVVHICNAALTELEDA